MKKVLVTLLAQKPSELSRFLKSYYQKEVIMEEGAFSWSCFYESPSESLNILSAIIDNAEDYQIEPLLIIDKVATLKVTNENLEDLIKLFVWI
ncbi:MAG: hypothetical protein IJ215_02730 [Clostridia bacterium]|nr:hypothetical protein [Clostridia bacterium]